MRGMGPTRLIVVDDEPHLRDMVAEYLSRHGFAVRTAADGVQLEAFLATEPADLVLLDIKMPGEDGLSIARRMLAASGVPFIMLTAVGDPVDRIIGLELGADDYIAKPFDLRELRARVRSVLRRTARPIASNASGAAVASGERVSFGAVALDLAARCLLHPDGRVSKLTAMEFDLLRTFAENPNRVLTRDRLLDLAHHRDLEPFDRSIDIRIARLRRKIEEDPAKPQVIKTIHGSGYMFVPTRT